MLKVYDFSVDSVDVLIFGKRDIESLTSLFKQKSYKEVPEEEYDVQKAGL